MPDLQEAVSLHGMILQNKKQDKEVQCDLADESDDTIDHRRRENYLAATEARKLERMRKKAQEWQIKYARVNDLLGTLKAKLQAAPVAEDEVIDAHEIQNTILGEMVSLVDVDKNQRRYSESFYRFAYIFMTLSPRAYKYVRKKLILPSKTSVWKHFHEATSSMKSSITDLSSVHVLLESFVQTYNPGSDRITATLAVDAFAFRLFLRRVASVLKIKESLQSKLRYLRPFLEDPKLVDEVNELDDDLTNYPDQELDELPCTDEENTEADIGSLFDVYNHCFMFVLIPLKTDIPSLTLHLCPAQSGSANEQQAEILDQLTKICRSHNIDIVYMSVDGDAGWNWKFHETLEVIAPHFDGFLYDNALTVLETCCDRGVHMATTDLLHLLKRARGRYLDHVITPSVNEILSTNYDRTCAILGCGPALSDKTQLGRMRDFYPLELFTARNVHLLMTNECFADAFYFLPFTLMLLLIRVPFFRQDFRLQLLEVAFMMFRHVYDDILSAKTRKGSESSTTEKVVQRPRSDSAMVTFAELGVLERILCTLYAYAAALQTHPDNLRTDSLGTHIVEEKIGQARQGMDDRWTRMLSTITQSAMRSLMLGIEQVELGSPSRLKATGCCIDGSGDFYIDEFDHVLVARVMTHSLSEAARADSDFQEAWKKVSSWIELIDSVLEMRSTEIGKVWMPSPGAHSGIMARLLKTDVSSITQ